MNAREDLERLRQELAQFVAGDNDPGPKPAEPEGLGNPASAQAAMEELKRLLSGSGSEQDPANWIVSKTRPPDTRTEPQEHDHTLEDEILLLEDRIDAEEPVHENATPERPVPAGEEVQRRELQETGTRFSGLKRGLVATAIGVALLIPGSGGFLFFVHAGPDTPAVATAAIPPLAVPPTLGPGHESAGELAVSTGLINPTANQGEVTAPSAGPGTSPAAAPQQSEATVSTATAAPSAVPPQDAEATVSTVTGAPSSEAGPPTAIIRGNSNRTGTDAAELLVRGDARFALADLAGARLLYERAATGGNALAALRLGQTYDPAFLARTRFRGVRGDPSSAPSWYMRADRLGAPEAEALLRALAADVGLSAVNPNKRPPMPARK